MYNDNKTIEDMRNLVFNNSKEASTKGGEKNG